MPGFSHKKIIELLKEREGEVLIAPNGKRIYALSKNASNETVLVILNSEENLTEKTVDEINQFIIDSLKIK